ncbi:hypothetical protein KIV56_17230 [Cryobacterium breve]|uniref:Uncharacterized protein n=1 Tax=Cryobacterium breve TaxID=1259258 RepID=A0ABY7NH83_9MICO|nr:hypothetical protein [Cryobacterium breve]WBM79888.1 hypothetical protein KIV56_17230 [Cryobacterium breve]
MSYPSTTPAGQEDSGPPAFESGDLDVLVTALLGVRDREMRGFAPGVDSVQDSEGQWNDFKFSIDVVSLVDIVSFLLELIPAKSVPTADRIGWDFAFEFQKTPCRLRWLKSGLWLKLWLPEGGKVSAVQVSNEIERRLSRASMSVYQKAILPLVRNEMVRNQVTVVNQFPRYRGMVDYFIGQLQELRAAGPPQRKHEPVDDADETPLSRIEASMSQVLIDVQHSREEAYVGTALLAAYFAYAQHVLVILTAFSPRALEERFSIVALLEAQWSEQFDIAFPPPYQGNIGRAKSDLSRLARNYRNPLLHGGGGRSADGMFVSWAPGRSVLVTDDGEPTSQFMLWQASLSSAELVDILARIERIDEAFEEHPFFGWVRAGLQAEFHPDAIRRALRALEGNEAGLYTMAADEELDRAVNWD